MYSIGDIVVKSIAIAITVFGFTLYINRGISETLSSFLYKIAPMALVFLGVLYFVYKFKTSYLLSTVFLMLLVISFGIALRIRKNYLYVASLGFFMLSIPLLVLQKITKAEVVVDISFMVLTAALIFDIILSLIYRPSDNI